MINWEGDRHVACIYKITDLTNYKVYIGQSTDFDDRMYDYKHDFRCLRKHKKPNGKGWLADMYRDGRTPDFELDFIVDVLSVVNNDELYKLNELEKFWIDYYQSNNPKYGYNKTVGGGRDRTIGKDGKPIVKTPRNPDKSTIDRMFFRTYNAYPDKADTRQYVTYNPDSKDLDVYANRISLNKTCGANRNLAVQALQQGKKLRNVYIFYYDTTLRRNAMKSLYQKRMNTITSLKKIVDKKGSRLNINLTIDRLKNNISCFLEVDRRICTAENQEYESVRKHWLAVMNDVENLRETAKRKEHHDLANAYVDYCRDNNVPMCDDNGPTHHAKYGIIVINYKTFKYRCFISICEMKKHYGITDAQFNNAIIDFKPFDGKHLVYYANQARRDATYKVAKEHAAKIKRKGKYTFYGYASAYFAVEKICNNYGMTFDRFRDVAK